MEEGTTIPSATREEVRRKESVGFIVVKSGAMVGRSTRLAIILLIEVAFVAHDGRHVYTGLL